MWSSGGSAPLRASGFALAFGRIARYESKSMKREWSIEGRAIGGTSGRELLSAIEAMNTICYETDAPSDARLADLWHTLLAMGPRRI
jgi:hypothetical protein